MKKLILIIALLASTSAFAGEDPIGGLLSKYNCTACHNADVKVVGPSFKDISAKYKGDAKAEDILVKKVSHGGKGVWGSTPMTANDPNEEHQADIRRAVRYVLSLTK